MENKEKKDVFDIIWDFFASVKLAVVILITLALTSIIGTIVEQRADQSTNIALLAKFFGDSFAPTIYNIFVNLGFMDMYHSWWFVTLLVMFSVNLIVCSLERLPKTVRLINTPMRPLGEKVIRTLAVRNELTVTAGLKVVKDEVLNILNSSNYRVLEATEEDAVQLYSQKGKYTRLGVYVVHLSILLIFVGAIIGSQFGFRGSLNLPEGESSNVVYAGDGEPIPLGFTIMCKWYNTEYYSGTGTPQDYKSELVVFENEKEVLKKVIEVNSPLTYKGITFYQSSYGMMPGALDEFIMQGTPGDGRVSTLQPTFSRFPNSIGRFILTVTPANGQPNTLALKRGDIFDIPGTDIKGVIIGFSPTLDRDRRTEALGTNAYYKDKLVSPAIAVEIDMPGKEKFVGWFLKERATSITPDVGHSIRFEDFQGIEYTGLQVAKDPGIWFIYLACIIMTIGLYACFFMSHKKIYVSITSDTSAKKGSVRIVVGGTSTKNRLGFEKETEKILANASRAIEERSKK